MSEPDIIDITEPKKIMFTKEINGLWLAVLDIEHNDKIKEESYVEFGGNLFIAKKINDLRLKDGSLLTSIKLDHLMTELNDFNIAPFEYIGVTCEAALASILSDTDWSVGTVDIEGTGDVKSKKRISVLKAINLVAKEFKGEIDWICNKYNGSFTRIVDIKTQIGKATKLLIRYDKNSDYIRREKDTIKLVTRLYLYGRDDITIESVNPTGKEYLDSAKIGDYKKIKRDTLYTNISDKTILMNYGQDYLDVYDSKILRYRINTRDLTIVPRWADEVINLGDTLRIQDTDLDLNVDVRVKKITKDLTDPRYQIIELANKFKSIVEPISTIEQTIENITFQNDYRALDFRDVSFPRDIPTGLPRTWYLYIGTSPLEIGDYQGPIVHIDSAGTAYEIWVYVAWKPTVSDFIVRLNRNGVNMGDVTIPWGAYVAPGEGEVGASGLLPVDFLVAYGDLLNLDIKDTDGVAARVSVALRCR